MIKLLKTVGRNDLDLFDEDFVEALFGNHPMEEIFVNNVMRTDIVEDEQKYLLSIEVPGFKKEDLKITFENGYLTVSGERTTSSDKKKFIRCEREFGKASRTYYLGEDVNEDEIRAEFNNGILVINVLKKAKESKQRLITIE